MLDASNSQLSDPSFWPWPRTSQFLASPQLDTSILGVVWKFSKNPMCPTVFLFAGKLYSLFLWTPYKGVLGWLKFDWGGGVQETQKLEPRKNEIIDYNVHPICHPWSCVLNNSQHVDFSQKKWANNQIEKILLLSLVLFNGLLLPSVI